MVEITIFLLAPRVKTTGNSVVDSSLFKPPATAHSFPTYENEVNLKTTQVRKGLWRNWKKQHTLGSIKKEGGKRKV